MTAKLRGQRHELPVRVGQAVSVICTGAYVNFSCLAHEVVVVRAFTALAGSDVGEDLGQAAVRSDINERGTGRVILGTADRDGGSVACRVIVKGTVAYAAVRNMSCHWDPPLSAARTGRPFRTQ